MDVKSFNIANQSKKETLKHLFAKFVDAADDINVSFLKACIPTAFHFSQFKSFLHKLFHIFLLEKVLHDKIFMRKNQMKI